MERFRLIFAFFISLSLLESNLASKKGPEPEAIISFGDFQVEDEVLPKKGRNKGSQANQKEIPPPPPIKYSDDPELWKDIGVYTRATASHAKGHFNLCVVGVYGMYEFAHFQAETERGVSLVGGYHKCMDISAEHVGSIQLITSFTNMFLPSISIFSSNYFRDPAFPITKSMKNLRDSFGESVESLVINGAQPWTYTSSSNVSYCLQPVFDNETILFPVCYLSTMNDTPIGNDTIWRSVKPKCTGKVDKTVEVNSCFALLDVVKPPPPVIVTKKPVVMMEHDEPEKKEQGCKLECNDDLKELLTLLDLRLNNDYSSMYQMRFPVDKTHAWRTEMLDLVFDIGIVGCPLNHVAPAVVPFIRETFIYFIEKKVWSKGAGFPKTFEEYDNGTAYGHVYDELLSCRSRISFRDGAEIASTMMQYASEHEDLSILPDFQRKPTYDLLMEIVWLLANQVASFCHVASNGNTNFWVDFYPIFKGMYLTPMIKHWKDPGKIKFCWDILLSGTTYSPTSLYEHSALCATTWISESHLDFYRKPRELDGAKNKA